MRPCASATHICHNSGEVAQRSFMWPNHWKGQLWAFSGEALQAPCFGDLGALRADDLPWLEIPQGFSNADALIFFGSLLRPFHIRDAFGAVAWSFLRKSNLSIECWLVKEGNNFALSCGAARSAIAKDGGPLESDNRMPYNQLLRAPNYCWRRQLAPTIHPSLVDYPRRMLAIELRRLYCVSPPAHLLKDGKQS